MVPTVSETISHKEQMPSLKLLPTPMPFTPGEKSVERTLSELNITTASPELFEFNHADEANRINEHISECTFRAIERFPQRSIFVAIFILLSAFVNISNSFQQTKYSKILKIESQSYRAQISFWNSRSKISTLASACSFKRASIFQR